MSKDKDRGIILGAKDILFDGTNYERKNKYQNLQNLDHNEVERIHNQYRFALKGIDYEHSFDKYTSDQSTNAKNLSKNFLATYPSVNKAAAEKAFEDLLRPEPADPIVAAKATYDHAVTKLNDILNEPNRKFSNEAIAEQLKTRKDEAFKAIEEQQKKEIEKLEVFFGSSSSTTTTTLDPILNGLTDLETFKKKAVDNLKARHEQQRADFSTNVEKSVTELNAIRKRFDNEAAVAINLAYGTEAMKEAIRKASEEANLKSLTLGMDPNSLDSIGIEGVDLENLFLPDGKTRVLDCFNGLPINKTPNESGGYNYSINVSRLTEFYTNWFFMQKDAEVADLKSVMTNTFMALMAADHKPDKKIVIYATSHATNEKIADSKAKWLLAIAYEAAIKAGYDPKNIEIKCNNKKIELDALPLTATERGILNNIAAEKQKFREAVVGPEHKTSSAPKTKAELEADSKKSKPELEADAKKAKDKFEAEAKETQGKLKDLTDQKPVTPAATPSTPTAK